jgi:drug/metabolite transporter (DMT)-like permease
VAQRHPHDQLLSLALSITPAVLWGVLAVAIAALGGAIDGVTLTWYRFGCAWLAQTVLLVSTNRSRGLFAHRGRELALIAVTAGGLVTNFVAFACSLRYLPPSTAQTFGQLQPVLLMIGGALFFRERLSALQRTGAAVLVAGLVIFLGGRIQLAGVRSSDLALGLGLVMLATVAWPVAALAQKALKPDVPSTHVLWYVYLMGFLVLAPGANAAELRALHGIDIGLFVFCCLNTLVAYGAFMLAVRHWHAARVSAIVALAPVVTYVAEWIVARVSEGRLHAESWTTPKLLGACLVVSGAMATALGRHVDRTPAQHNQRAGD